ncbi:hypothetical protein AB0E26_31120, partial [Streptomyces sp. NPDC047976]
MSQGRPSGTTVPERTSAAAPRTWSAVTPFHAPRPAASASHRPQARRGPRHRRPEPELRELLLGRIKDVPDYPKPGVVFKDITPLL